MIFLSSSSAIFEGPLTAVISEKPGHSRPGQSFFNAHTALGYRAVKRVDRCSPRERGIHLGIGLHRIPDLSHPDCLDAMLVEHELLVSCREACIQSRTFVLLRIIT